MHHHRHLYRQRGVAAAAAKARATPPSSLSPPYRNHVACTKELRDTTEPMNTPTASTAAQSPCLTDLESRLRSVLRTFPGLELALLFGSLARGGGRPDSDVDLAVQAGQPLSAQERMDLIDAIAQAAERPVDLVDLRTAGEPTLGQVMRHGRRILGSDAAHGRLLYRQLVDQSDFMPLRDRILEERRVAWIGK